MSDTPKPKTAVDVWLDEKTNEAAASLVPRTDGAEMQDAKLKLIAACIGQAYWRGKMDGIDQCQAILEKNTPK